MTYTNRIPKTTATDLRHDVTMSNTSKATLTANGSMDTKEGIQDVTRAAMHVVEADLNYLRDEGVDGPRYESVMRRVADRLAVQAARIRLAIGYGGET